MVDNTRDTGAQRRVPFPHGLGAPAFRTRHAAQGDDLDDSNGLDRLALLRNGNLAPGALDCAVPVDRATVVVLRRLLLIAVAVGAMVVTVAAMRYNSTTFDEITFIAGGARGFHMGDFAMMPEHPPLMQYMYGLPVYLSGPAYPVEHIPKGAKLGFAYRYLYAQAFFAMPGNSAERLAFLGRLPAALMVLLLVLATYGFARHRIGPWPALAAATLVALLPDVLAHGGVAYNDLPLALAYLLAVWALDAAVRAPGLRTGAAAGLAAALAIAVKFSGGAAVVVGLALLGAEATSRWRDRRWWRQIALAAGAASIAGYLGLVLVYRGDFRLTELWYGLHFTFLHVSEGHGAPAFLLGRVSPNGWWYFFPVAFLFKTPVALHALALLALLGTFGGRKLRELRPLAGQLRAPLLGLVVFTAFLLVSHLDIGFRYALPVLPLLCILVAAGVARLWAGSGRAVRVGIAGLLLWNAVAVLSFYPYFLTFTSAYGPGRDRGDEVLLDSSLDWGQGLLALKDFMRQEKIGRVYLAYFGSALPSAYGIDYAPLPSYFPLPPAPRRGREEPTPGFAVISATLLYPLYMSGDPYARFRRIRPYRILAHDLFVFRVHD
jgi:4-amino-4-deoxy-L-arabinose transferase-like glycosyltransferase